MQLTRPAHDQWCRLVIDGTKISSTGFINFSNHDTSNIPDLSNTNVNPSLTSQTKMWLHVFRSGVRSYIFIFSGYVPDLYFVFSYVVIIYLLRRGGVVGIYCQLIPDWIESTWAQILLSCQMYNRDIEPNSRYYLGEYFNIKYSKYPHFIYILWLQLHPKYLVLELFLEPIPNLSNFLNPNHMLNTLI